MTAFLKSAASAFGAIVFFVSRSWGTPLWLDELLTLTLVEAGSLPKMWAGIVSGIETDEAQRQVHVSPEDIEQVITRSRQCTSLERLQIYGNAYYARLIECLQDEFPALRHALGDETFDAFALAYLQDCPSRSYTLSKLGTEFPRFLRETRPLDIPPESNWPEFLVDLATLERTYSEDFDAPGPERLTLLRSEDLLAIPSERWPDARLKPSAIATLSA